MKRSIVADIRREQIRRLAAEGQREDGRTLEQFRELEIEVGPIQAAEGSARVRLGRTDLIVGVKMQPGTPYPDKPDEGVLMTGVELKPMAHQDFEGGMPSPEAVEVARVVDRGIRESGMVDFKALCMKPGEDIWMLFLDAQILDYDGNAIDAVAIGGLLALHNTVVPAKRFGRGEDFPLPVRGWPVTVTTIKVNGGMLVDPTFIEESVAKSRLSICLDDDGAVRAMQKGLSGALTYDEVASALQLAGGLARDIRSKIAGKGE